MFRYKDLRMLIISIILIFICIASMIYFIHEKIKLIIILFLIITLLPTLVLRFNAKIFNDAMMVYVFKGIGILPEMIEFVDVQDFKQISKHKIVIYHKKVSKLCLVNGDAFMQELNEKYDRFKNYNKRDMD